MFIAYADYFLRSLLFSTLKLLLLCAFSCKLIKLWSISNCISVSCRVGSKQSFLVVNNFFILWSFLLLQNALLGLVIAHKLVEFHILPAEPYCLSNILIVWWGFWIVYQLMTSHALFPAVSRYSLPDFSAWVWKWWMVEVGQLLCEFHRWSDLKEFNTINNVPPPNSFTIQKEIWIALQVCLISNLVFEDNSVWDDTVFCFW